MSGEVSPSGRDTPERPVREKFRKTTIDGQVENSDSREGEVVRSSEAGEQAENSTISSGDTKSNGERGRIRRKRSHEELNNDKSSEEPTAHSRKKSRDAKDERTSEASFSSASSDADSGGVSLNKAISSDATKDVNEMKGLPGKRSETPPIDTDNVMTEAERQRSPPTKRSRDKYDQDHKAADGLPSVSEVLQKSSEVNDSSADAEKQDGISEPESKRKKDESKNSAHSDYTQVLSGSGFSNASSVSPFASLSQGNSNSSTAQTSPSAFAASGFAALSTSATSPFANLSGSNTGLSSGGFGTPLANSTSTEKPAPSGFAALGASSRSPFATSSFGSASSSGFGQLGGAKSIFSASGGPLKSFATPGGSSTFGSSKKPPKPFGAADEADDDDDDEENGENEDNDADPTDDGDEQQDSRFREQEVETGEEDESTVFQGRAKLFVSLDQAWKERGVGIFKINVKRDDWDTDEEGEEDEQKQKQGLKRLNPARFIMRADGSHRIVINSKITKEITIDDPAKGPPTGKMAMFLGFFDGKPQTVLVRFRTNALATELYETVKNITEGI